LAGYFIAAARDRSISLTFGQRTLSPARHVGVIRTAVGDARRLLRLARLARFASRKS
jgi:hypothetical protein